MEISTPYAYSTGWLQKFKDQHRIRYLRTCGEKASVDNKASDYFVEEIMKLIINEKIPYNLIYNADETSLFWG